MSPTWLMVLALPRSTVIHSVSLQPELHRLDTLPSTAAVAGQVVACTEEEVTALFKARFTEVTGDVVVVWAIAVPEPPPHAASSTRILLHNTLRVGKVFTKPLLAFNLLEIVLLTEIVLNIKIR